MRAPETLQEPWILGLLDRVSLFPTFLNSRTHAVVGDVILYLGAVLVLGFPGW